MTAVNCMPLGWPVCPFMVTLRSFSGMVSVGLASCGGGGGVGRGRDVEEWVGVWGGGVKEWVEMWVCVIIIQTC